MTWCCVCACNGLIACDTEAIRLVFVAGLASASSATSAASSSAFRFGPSTSASLWTLGGPMTCDSRQNRGNGASREGGRTLTSTLKARSVASLPSTASTASTASTSSGLVRTARRKVTGLAARVASVVGLGAAGFRAARGAGLTRFTVRACVCGAI